MHRAFGISYIDKFTMHNSQCTITERALRAYLNRDEITWFCLRIVTDLVSVLCQLSLRGYSSHWQFAES